MNWIEFELTDDERDCLIVEVNMILRSEYHPCNPILMDAVEKLRESLLKIKKESPNETE